MAVSLKKPRDVINKTDLSKSSVPEKLPEYTPVHLTDEPEPLRPLLPKQVSDNIPNIVPTAVPNTVPVKAAAGTPKNLIALIILLVVVILGLLAAGVFMIAGRVRSSRAVVNEIADNTTLLPEPGQDTTFITYEQPAQDNASYGYEEPSPIKNKNPFYGTMGSVTILGIEYDIATTSTLHLYYEEITDDDVEKIGQLTNLTKLSLDIDYIYDITPLANLTKLTDLHLDGNCISDITPLTGLTDLKKLDLGSNLVGDLSPLSGMTNLTELNLRCNQINDLSPLSELTSLTELDLSVNQINDLSPLFGLTGLTKLRLDYNLIDDSDIEELQKQIPGCEITFQPYIKY